MSDEPPFSDQRTSIRREADQASWYLAGIVASSNDAIIGKSLDGTIFAWNAAAERLYGYAAEETVGHHVSIIVPPEGRDELSALLERIRSGERIPHHWARHACKDGTIILVSLSISPVHDVNGKVVGAATIARDITAQKAAEDQVRAASLYARSLIEVSINPLVTISPEGKITDVNAATEEATGLSREQLIGSDFADYFTEPEKARAGYLRVLEEGLVRDYPLILRNASGTLMDVEYNATVLRDEAGELQGVFAAARDVTEAKRAQEQVARLAAIVTSSQDAIFSKDLDGTLTTWNAAAEALYGYSAEEAIGRSVEILMPPGRAGEAQELTARVLRGDRVSGHETQRMRKDGSLLDVALTMSPIRDSAGDIVAVSVIGHDITGRTRAERELRQSEAKFAAAFHTSPDLMAVTRITDGTILAVNEAFSRLLGHTRTESIGKTTSELSIWADPADRATFVAGLEESGQINEFETTLRRKDGTLITCIDSARTIEFQGETCILSVVHDITERKRAEGLVRAASLYARSLIEASLDPLVTISPEGKITDVNEATVQVTGVPRGTLIGTDFCDYFTEPETARAGYREVLQTGQVRDYSLSLRHVSGSVTEVEYNATVYRSEAGELQGVFAAARDVTKSRALEDELRVMSLRDELTGLYNRRGFALLAEQRVEESRRSASALTIVYADLDHLKSVNDAHGHNAGDMALDLCARALEATYRKSDIVARIGGDEFVVLTEADAPSTGTMTMRLKQELDRLTAAADLPFSVSLTVGSAHSKPPHALPLDDLLKQADAVMYEHKHRAPPQSG